MKDHRIEKQVETIKRKNHYSGDMVFSYYYEIRIYSQSVGQASNIAHLSVISVSYDVYQLQQSATKQPYSSFNLCPVCMHHSEKSYPRSVFSSVLLRCCYELSNSCGIVRHCIRLLSLDLKENIKSLGHSIS